MNHCLLFALSTFLVATATPAQRAPCTGTLQDPTGAAIAGAKVTFCQELSQTFGRDPDRVEVKTNERGAFTAPLLLGSPYVVWAIGPADADGARYVTGVSMQAAAGKALELVAARRARPHAVRLRGVTPWKEHVPPALRVLVGGNYPLGFDRPLSGDCTLQLGPWPGYEVEFAIVDDKRQLLCRVGPTAEDAGEVVFPPLCTIAVEAVDELKAALEGVEVSLRPDQWRPGRTDCDPLPPAPWQSWRVVARTDVRGRAILPLPWSEGGRDTSYTFAAAAEAHLVSFSGIRGGKPLTVSQGTRVPFQFVMSASPPRRVFVRDGDGRPRGWVALLSRCPYDVNWGGGMLSHLASAKVVDGEVRLSAANGTTSRCLVRLAASAGAPVRVCIGESRDEHDFTVNLRELRLRSLVVRDAAGQPAPFAQVVIAHRFGQGSLFEHDRCVADAAGRVELRSSAVTWDIIAVTDTGMGWSRIEPEDPRDTVRVNLLPIGSCRFRIVDAEGQPVADARLAGSPSWRGRPDDFLVREVALNLALSRRSDHDGMLVVPMPYGEFREVRIVRGGRQTWRQTVRPGEEVLTVELR